ncbi:MULTISPECIES: ribosome maturation factor RimM [unclassified Herbaspirillum]|uniref:ribosome maturation factor RimM n=1 Tax=unclassified Herbaspirillum TaxID=2624150 RepID=UPI0011535A39|nr:MULTISPECIES: ribosome maturation factor RimM [unclassified Herbaspirillum]MBB5391099.1 16S rRNA processing protein RimM [Herbaspirillum sp. SJZ102]TQK13210.1 16S rRNA processing protein RimM [Herbaspirillum sp. SJZ130]TQK15214.1 16S rRNA processing protein RimM [Herbaspirillum sp. SJZ106]
MNNPVQAGIEAPGDLVIVGHVTGAYGIQGWIRVRPYSAQADALLNAKTWWLEKSGLPKQDAEVMQSKGHSGDVVARLTGVADRNAAEALKGNVVYISRKHFPALDDDEFYWVDLIGASVENLQGEQLGVVADMMDNGAHPILRVAMPAQEAGQGAEGKPASQPELLIPFVGQFVKTVQQAEKKIIVDWGLDY